MKIDAGYNDNVTCSGSGLTHFLLKKLQTFPLSRKCYAFPRLFVLAISMFAELYALFICVICDWGTTYRIALSTVLVHMLFVHDSLFTRPDSLYLKPSFCSKNDGWLHCWLTGRILCHCIPVWHICFWQEGFWRLVSSLLELCWRSVSQSLSIWI